ncbi:hypothetical protein [uncultured Gemmiger sp.]|uniref:hypothetical protein n=1 Tax=uncultured Gemmiger sp. TaxID=1623490 RepID=UPI0025DC2DE0|nr:hypothetical protein [uncultured Gemmiger sp.]
MYHESLPASRLPQADFSCTNVIFAVQTGSCDKFVKFGKGAFFYPERIFRARVTAKTEHKKKRSDPKERSAGKV